MSDYVTFDAVIEPRDRGGTVYTIVRLPPGVAAVLAAVGRRAAGATIHGGGASPGRDPARRADQCPQPQAVTLFLSLLTPFLSGDPATVTLETLILGGAFMAMTLAVFLIYGAFAAATRDRLLSSARAMAWLNRSFAAIFVALAGRLAVERT